MKDRTARSTVEELRRMSQPEETAEVHVPLIGVVTDCLQLRVRSTPKVTYDNTVTVIDALSEVEVDEEASTEDFYKVCTASGIEGFCMKKFIALKH